MERPDANLVRPSSASEAASNVDAAEDERRRDCRRIDLRNKRVDLWLNVSKIVLGFGSVALAVVTVLDRLERVNRQVEVVGADVKAEVFHIESTGPVHAPLLRSRGASAPGYGTVVGRTVRSYGRSGSMGSVLLRLWDWSRALIQAHRGQRAAIGIGFLLGCLVCTLTAYTCLSFLPQSALTSLGAAIKHVEPVPPRSPQNDAAREAPSEAGGVPDRPVRVSQPTEARLGGAEMSAPPAAKVAQALREARDYESSGHSALALESCLSAYRQLPPTVRKRVDASSPVRLAAIEVNRLEDVEQLRQALSTCKAQLGTPAVRDLIGGRPQ
jgi:hypothetical protein